MLEKFFSPRGRVTRLQNLGYELLVFVSMWVVGAVLSFAVFGTMYLVGVYNESLAPGSELSIIFLLLTLVAMYSNIIIKIKRLHDMNLSGWWLPIFLLLAIPYIALYFWPGTKGKNRFDEDNDKTTLLYFKFSKRVKATFTNQKPIILIIALSAIVPLAMTIYHYTLINKIETPLESLAQTPSIENKEDIPLMMVGNKKKGYIDKKGNWVIQPMFDFVGKFTEGLTRVELNDKWGYIDKKGNWIIQPIFDSALDFTEGLAIVRVNNKNGYIDKKGNWVIQPMFDSTGKFTEGLAIDILQNSNKRH